MAERTRPNHEPESLGPSSGSDDLFGAGAGMATVSSGGLFNENLPVANLTVGEVRRRFRDRLDIDPNSSAEIDGRVARDDEIVRAGQLLTFVRHSGEKGTAKEKRWLRRHAKTKNGTPTLTVEENTVRAFSPEGEVAQMSVEDFAGALARPRLNTCGLALPTGTKLLYSRGRLSILVYETPPQVRTLKWIAEDSVKRWGGATYRSVRIALPYVIVLATFDDNGLLGDRNECFFRVAPLEDESDELLYPALLNCSRFQPPEGRPLSWICTQKLDRSRAMAEPNPTKRIRIGFRLLMECLMQTGFNYSSEDHEFSSWFTESTRIDPRIATIEKWQEATEKEGPLFALDVPWLKTGRTVAQVADRMFRIHGIPENQVKTDRDLQRIVFNYQRRS